MSLFPCNTSINNIYPEENITNVEILKSTCKNQETVLKDANKLLEEVDISVFKLHEKGLYHGTYYSLEIKAIDKIS